MKAYTIIEACNDVAAELRGHPDQSVTTIRCAINDQLDEKGKQGYKVNHDYCQPKAIRLVKALLH